MNAGWNEGTSMWTYNFDTDIKVKRGFKERETLTQRELDKRELLASYISCSVN